MYTDILKNLIIFHYHFLPGGVTDVVTSAVIAYMRKSIYINRVTIVSGRTANTEKLLSKIRKSIPDEKKDSVHFEHMPSIDYLENLSQNESAETVAAALLNRYKSKDNVWWIHNYHLGKNPYFTKALLGILKNNNQKMVLHIHDFPECSRYSLLNRLRENIREDLYPINKNVHYAVINNRDYNYLRNAGIQEELISLLENPISPVIFKEDAQRKTLSTLSGELSSSFSSWKEEEPYMLYPVRAIRRKNIAEAAIIAVLSDRNLIVTLPGESDAEKKYSDKCLEIFKRGLVPGMFGIGFAIENHNISFQELISSSSLILSTSVQEGFGYLFLNSMNWGKPLFARDLDILESFKESFENYPAYFYDKIKVPLNESDKTDLLHFYKEKIESSPIRVEKRDKERLNRSFSKILKEEYIDFSYLSLDMQITILEKLKSDNLFLLKCRAINNNQIKIINKYFDVNVSPNHEILEKFEHSYAFDSLRTNRKTYSNNIWISQDTLVYDFRQRPCSFETKTAESSH